MMPAMKMEKSPPELVERFGVFMEERFPDVERRKMFGYPAAFVNGNLATGLFASSWFVRLPEGDSGGMETLTPMEGRPMRGYYVLPEGVVADDGALTPMVRAAVGHTRSLPPK
jgi:hypothetical protein